MKKRAAPSAASATFRTPGDAARWLRQRYPFVPGDKMTPWDLRALEALMAASDIPEGYMSADAVNDLIERWSDPDHKH